MHKLKRSTWQGFLSTEQNKKQEKQEQLFEGTAAKSRDLIYVVAIPITEHQHYQGMNIFIQRTEQLCKFITTSVCKCKMQIDILH